MTEIPALDAAGAPDYIARRFGITPEQVKVTALSGGISNDVLLIETPAERFVLKQALGQLRVRDYWASDRERILQEAAVLQRLAPVLPDDALPRVLFVDPSHYCYAMTAAPPGAQMWKTLLMRGDVSAAVAERIGALHGLLIRHSWDAPEYARDFGDQTNFEQLRLEPYYQFTAARHPELASCFAAAQHRCRTNRHSLVHGDWSPKNMMVSEDSVMIIDFEVVHCGDASFDVAFLLTHLMLKSFYNPAALPAYREAALQYWQSLTAAYPGAVEDLQAGTLLQWPLLLLARMDGKSPAEYIQQKDPIRAFAYDLLQRPPQTIAEAWERRG